MYEIPAFKEVYTKQQRGEIVITKCELIDKETNDILAFGLTRISATGKYKKSIAKKLSYAAAMRYLFIKVTGGEISVEESL